MKKENWLLIVVGILFLLGSVEFHIFKDYLAVFIIFVCMWNTFLSWIIIKCLKKSIERR